MAKKFVIVEHDNDKYTFEAMLRYMESTSVDAKMPECLAENEETALRDKDLVKLWINHYQRYDTLPKKDRKDAFTRWDNVMQKRSDIFNFGNEDVVELVELKIFLSALTT